MKIFKNINHKEFIGFVLTYAALFLLAFLTNDSKVALISAFCGISYTILAGKGIPVCYPIGATGSIFYAYLSFASQLWGNLILYVCYYIPMQIFGFFQWNKNLKLNKYEIVKTQLNAKEKLYFLFSALLVSFFVILILFYFNDKNPVADAITTVFSILGMYLTVKRVVEQWIVWIIVNGLSFIMWLDVALKGEKVYSTVFMWGVYFLLAIYFYIVWKKEISQSQNN